ncbi:hypothetical protein CONLIGDRAFT_687839 [Coniochaeta ligniaria NRRL 30616]|uniref:Uncharacterized protein n=1 Tax=Coniochaeta ligniaria NRRL 30616 TaxID=1408157 RepID=A0A1J7J3P7_9PEZI|nr:hypothetical protein CONLIGDRAFT_687839 [Coniochaeta ligniaria NRRL 30616]
MLSERIDDVYINNEYETEELHADPPAKPVIEKIRRNVLDVKPIALALHPRLRLFRKYSRHALVVLILGAVMLGDAKRAEHTGHTGGSFGVLVAISLILACSILYPAPPPTAQWKGPP